MDSLGKHSGSGVGGSDFGGSLESEDMDVVVSSEQPLFSAESSEDFRPRSSTWHGSQHRQQQQLLLVPGGAMLSVDCRSPYPSGASDELDFDAPTESSAVLSPFGGVGGLVAGGGGSGSRDSLSPAVAASGRSSVSAHHHHQQLQQQQKRRNAWGSQSYADLITQAIECSPQKRLTLSEIYDWMIKNIDFFSNKGDTNSSAGWKNSVRHNLSLHNKFVRVQNEHTGKSSYWTVDYGVKDRASYRRRAPTADSSELLRRRHAAQARRRSGDCGAGGGGGSGGRKQPDAPAVVRQLQSKSQVAATVMHQPQSELQVASVLHQLVPPDRLLDQSQPIETLLVESLLETVLESEAAAAASAASVSPGAASSSSAAAAETPTGTEPLRSLTDQLHLMTCRQAAAAAAAAAASSAGDSGSSSCCLSAQLCLLDEAAEATAAADGLDCCMEDLP